jgi:hypothetical protein
LPWALKFEDGLCLGVQPVFFGLCVFAGQRGAGAAPTNSLHGLRPLRSNRAGEVSY